MSLTRKVAGAMMPLVGTVFFLLRPLTVTGSDLGGLPTFLGICLVFVPFGILTMVSCTFLGKVECEGEAPWRG